MDESLRVASGDDIVRDSKEFRGRESLKTVKQKK
jgi:hypothetical protein